jgi:peptide deformylase
MEIVSYPHPALRCKARDVTQIDEGLRGMVDEMFALMYQAKGIGLAATQVAVPLRLFVVNLSGEAAEKDEEIVFINPEIIKRRGAVMGEEGCLSLPGLYADVQRADKIVVEAFDLEGQPFRAELNELAARVVQHETDHLDGVLFIDRVDDSVRRAIDPKVSEFEIDFRAKQAAGSIPSDDELRSRLERFAQP